MVSTLCVLGPSGLRPSAHVAGVIWQEEMKNLYKVIMLCTFLLGAHLGYCDSEALYEPGEIQLSSKEAKKLGFSPYISKGQALDAEVSMIVNFPKEINGEPVKNVIVRLFHNELSISTHSVSVGSDEDGNKQAWVN